MEFDHPGIRFKMEVTDDSDAFATPLPPIDSKVEANEELDVDDMSDSMSTMSRHLMDFSDHHEHREASGSTDSGMVVSSTANSSMDETDAMPPPPPLIDVIDSVTVPANKEESQIEPQTRVRSNTWPLPRLIEQEEEEISSCHNGQLVGAQTIGTHAQQLYQPHTILQQHHYSTPMAMQIQFQAPSPLSSTTSSNQALVSNAVTTIGTQQQQQQNKKNSSRRNAWGNMSYADLITQAIGSTPDQRLTLSQIYDWMVANIPYFKDKGDSNSSAGWKNSIRHNLSLHNRFVRVQNEGTGKSSWWMINPDAKPGKSARRRSTSMETSKYEKKRGRVKKKVDGLRNGLVVTPDTGSLCSASPASSIGRRALQAKQRAREAARASAAAAAAQASRKMEPVETTIEKRCSCNHPDCSGGYRQSYQVTRGSVVAYKVSEGLDMFPDSPLHAGGHPFQLSPSFRPRAASDASSCGRLSPISGALEPDSAGGWTAGIVSRATLFSHMPPPLISSASSAASSSSSLSTALAAAAAQHHQQQNMIDQQQLVDNMADGMKIRQESSPPTPVGLYHHQQPSPSSFGEYQGKLTPGGSQVLSGSSPNPGDMGQTVSYSLTSLQAVSPMPSVSPSHPTSTTPGCQDMVSSTPGYSPGDPTSAATTPTGGASAGMSPRGTPNLQRHEAGFYHLATAENGAAALMGEAMGVALAYSQNGGGSGSSAGATSAEIDLNLDSFPDPLDCNVDELIKHELRMDGSLDFAFNGHYHHHHHHHAAQLHHHQAAYGAATAGANGQFVQFMAQQPVMIQHSNGSAFAHHYPAFNYHHHQLEPMSSDTSFPVVQSFIGAPPSSQGSAGTPHPISPSASRSWVR